MRIYRQLTYGAVLVVLLSAAGCASYNPVVQQQAIDALADSIESRTSYQIEWEVDQEVEQHVDALLADSLGKNEAVHIAMVNNYALRAKLEEIGIARVEWAQAGVLKNPTLGTHLGYPEDGDHGPDLAVSLSMDFMDLLYRKARKEVAESAYDATVQKVEGDVLALVDQVQVGWYSVIASAQMLEMMEQVLRAAESRYTAARLLREAGNITESTFLTEQLFYEKLQVDFANAEVQVFEDKEHLNRLMGIWKKGSDWTTLSRLPELPGSSEMEIWEAEEKAIAQSLDLAQASEQVARLSKAYGLTRVSSVLPALSVGVSAEREEGEWERGPEVGLPLPLFDQGNAIRASAMGEIRKAQAEYHALAVDIRSQTRMAYLNVEAAYRKAVHHKKVLLPLSVQAAAAMQKEYNAMQVGVFQLVQSRQQEIEAGMGYIDALKTYWVHRSRLDMLLSGKWMGAAPIASTRPVNTSQASIDTH